METGCRDSEIWLYLISFLKKKRWVILENIFRSYAQQMSWIKSSNNRPNCAVTKFKSLVINSNKNNSKPCILCSYEQPLFKCKNFSNLSVLERKEFVERNKLCENCLRKHLCKCNSKFKCQMCCYLLHNTLLCGIKNGELIPIQNDARPTWRQK